MMAYVILAYDIGVERVDSVRLLLKQYLNWVQNSLFEGDLTEAELLRVKEGIKERIDEGLDSVVIYRIDTSRYLQTIRLGTTKGEISTIL